MKAGDIFKDFLAEMQKLTQKVKCYKCGVEIEYPNPPIKVVNSWGCAAKTVFINAYIIVNGWHVRNRGITDNHPFYCPDCWDGTEPEYSKHPKSDEWVEKGNEWLKANKSQRKNFTDKYIGTDVDVVYVVLPADIDLSWKRIRKDIREQKNRSDVPYFALVRQKEQYDNSLEIGFNDENVQDVIYV